jgi:hypothetical protein
MYTSTTRRHKAGATAVELAGDDRGGGDAWERRSGATAALGEAVGGSSGARGGGRGRRRHLGAAAALEAGGGQGRRGRRPTAAVGRDAQAPSGGGLKREQRK